MVWMIIIGSGLFVGRRCLVGTYTDDPNVQRLGEICLTFVAVAQPLQAVAIVLASALRGTGGTRATLIITSICVGIVRVGVGYVLGIVYGLGLFGV